jgi:ABC-type transport system involved in multi-copper enzyme maturation permease subunit
MRFEVYQHSHFRSKGLQKIFAIALLTWKAAFRFRLFLVLAVLLLGSVVGLPLLIKDDGTARGFTQILLTYTLSTVSALLGLSTLWLACGTLARDVEECQIQVVAVKPIARWQIWLGKWLGIMSLNAVLLLLCGASIYALLLWRASRLPADQQWVLRQEVLVARGSARPVNPEKEIDRRTDELLQERRKAGRISESDLPEMRMQIREQLKAGLQVVPPGLPHAWTIDLGRARLSLRDQPLYLRVKFNSADMRTLGTFGGLWAVGVPGKTPLWRSDLMSLACDTFHEFPIPPNLFDESGTLTVSFFNPNEVALLFSMEEGIEVLYRETSFEVNYLRGLGIIFCWMGLLAALGLAAASFLSFPVAAFLSLGILTLVFSTGTMANALEVGTIAGYNAEKGTRSSSSADLIALPTFRVLLKLISLAKDFSPIDSLSTGRSITWTQLGLAFSQIVLVLGGTFAVFGIVVFTRRELAAAQGA